MTRARLSRFVVACLAAALLGACYLPFGDPNPARARSAALRDLESAVSHAQHEEVLALADQLASLEPDPPVAVIAASRGLQAAIALGAPDPFGPLVARLDDALAQLDATAMQRADRPSENDRIRADAEEALRATHELAFERWSGGGSDAWQNHLTQSSAAYRAHFGDALAIAEVLWRDAEMLRRLGRGMDAVPLYEEIRRKDFLGQFGDRALDRIATVWTSASESTALPADVPEQMDVPSPHAEWISLARERRAARPEDPVSWKDALRIAQIQLAYRQRDEGYTTLRDIIDHGPDRFAVDAATMMLEHAAVHGASSREFKTLRKELQGNKTLWADRDFRGVVSRLRKQVEGR